MLLLVNHKCNQSDLLSPHFFHIMSGDNGLCLVDTTVQKEDIQKGKLCSSENSVRSPDRANDKREQIAEGPNEDCPTRRKVEVQRNQD